MQHSEMMQPPPLMSRGDIELMLIHAIRSQEVAAVAVDKLLPEHFNNPGEDAYRLLWLIAQEFYKLYTKPITQLVMSSSLTTRFQLFPNLLMAADQIVTLVEWIYSVDDKEFIPEAGLALLQQFLNERVFQPSLQLTGSSAAEVIDEINRIYSSTRVAMSSNTNVFDLTDPRINTSIKPAIPSGSAVFDFLLDGGIRSSHMTGVLAPFGGGKTALGIEVAVNLAKQKKHVLICQYEQDVMLDVRPRVWSCATGIPTKVFAENTFENLAPAIQDKVRSLAYMGDYLHIEDLHHGLAGGGGVAEIEALALKLQSMQQAPALIVVDWLGVLVRKYLMAKNLPFEKHMHAAYNELISRIRNLANKFNCEVIVLHQLNADAGKRGPTARPSMYEAAEFRGFAALMDTCILIGKADKSGIALMYTDKNRGQRGDSFVRIHGDRCKFELLNGNYMYIANDSTGEAGFQDLNASGSLAGIS